MTGFRVGVGDGIFRSPDRRRRLPEATYLVRSLIAFDSFWVPDHLNQLFPRSLWQQKYCGATKLIPKIDAVMEPWTMLGHIAGRNRVGRLRLGVAVTDTRSTQPGRHRPGRRNAALAHPRKGDPGYRTRGTGRKRALRCRLVQAGRAF